MPYCPKCGVEINKNRKTCPLCHYHIPPIEDEEEGKESNFPHAENIYKEELKKKKNLVFYTLIVVLSSMLGIFFIIDEVYQVDIMSYFIASTLGAMFYLFFIFGYMTYIYSILGSLLTTVFLTYWISRLTADSDWFLNLALPIISLVGADYFFMDFLYKRYKFRSKFIYVPVLFLIFVSILSFGIDLFININRGAGFQFTWSLIVATVTLPLALIMLGIYHKTPERIKESMKKKFHI